MSVTPEELKDQTMTVTVEKVDEALRNLEASRRALIKAEEGRLADWSEMIYKPNDPVL